MLCELKEPPAVSRHKLLWVTLPDLGGEFFVMAVAGVRGKGVCAPGILAWESRLQHFTRRVSSQSTPNGAPTVMPLDDIPTILPGL